MKKNSMYILAIILLCFFVFLLYTRYTNNLKIENIVPIYKYSPKTNPLGSNVKNVYLINIKDNMVIDNNYNIKEYNSNSTVNYKYIYFDAEGRKYKDNSDKYKMNSDSKEDIPIPSKKGYSFTGYYDINNNKIFDLKGNLVKNNLITYNNGWKTSSDIVLYAHYKKIETQKNSNTTVDEKPELDLNNKDNLNSLSDRDKELFSELEKQIKDEKIIVYEDEEQLIEKEKKESVFHRFWSLFIIAIILIIGIVITLRARKILKEYYE